MALTKSSASGSAIAALRRTRKEKAPPAPLARDRGLVVDQPHRGKECIDGYDYGSTRDRSRLCRVK
jgi:hypothetical protein